MATTTKTGGKILKDISGPSLRSFIRKSKAIALYRDLFRMAKLFPEDELIIEIKTNNKTPITII